MKRSGNAKKTSASAGKFPLEKLVYMTPSIHKTIKPIMTFPAIAALIFFL